MEQVFKTQWNGMGRFINANQISLRTYRIAAGKYQPSTTPQTIVPSITDEAPQTVQSDQTGFHKLVKVEFCSDQLQCHQRQCDTIHQDICPHKKGDPATLIELGGGLTHAIPKDKQGVELSLEDMNGESKYGSQKLVTEKTSVPLDKSNFKENEKATEFVQQEDISKKIIKSLPLNSPLKLKETSECETPKDYDE